ncbi:FprA family A-type flavoprotein [Endomicrobium proavitum]|uniref:FprA family A-type flavoprotein n=1 Tax=Endomicrobium proavitum TaxID=1408281 RepID=UPI0006965F79|nr:FprA family A-type flavoprotein [Endomicrobium proavitum]
MSARIIKENVYSVGAIDWDERHFHGYTYVTKRGVTYNSYLIMDEKITLIDTVRDGFQKEWLGNIKAVTDPSKIEVVIINHIEPDHSGGFPEIVKLCPNAQFYGTEKARAGLLKYYGVQAKNWTSVKSGASVNIGKRTLDFIDAAMLHWPDNMFTYSAYDKILFSNDGFGQHYATDKVFDDEVDYAAFMDELQKYYANILWPFSQVLAAKLAAIAKLNLQIELIAPSHGLVLRKYIPEVMEKYLFWSKNSTVNKIAVVFETMWKSTEAMAKKIVEGIASEGVDAVLFDVTKTDRTDIAAYMLDAKGFIFGSSTHDGEMLPVIAGFLHFLKGSKAKNRKAFAFGSYGWSGEAVQDIQDTVGNIAEFGEPVKVVFASTQEELDKCFQAGKEFAKKIKAT